LVATDNTPATTALRRDDRQLEDRWNLPSSVSAAPTLNQRAENITGPGFLKRHFCFEFCSGRKTVGFQPNPCRNHRLRDLAVPMSTNGLLNDIAEAKGRQTLYPHHDVPEADLRRRFLPGLRNFFSLYLPLADETLLFIFNAAGRPPKLIAR
jgi:hypothetical protein